MAERHPSPRLSLGSSQRSSQRHSRRLLPALAVAALVTAVVAPPACRADYTGSMSNQERQIYDYGPSGSNGSSKGGSVLDSTNPLDLMNKIRRGTALDDATDPGDAIDAALKELEVQTPTASQPALHPQPQPAPQPPKAP